MLLWTGRIKGTLHVAARAWRPTRNHPWEEQACATRRLKDVRKQDMEHCVDFSLSSRSCWRTEQVQPLQWEHGVWPCAAAAADSKWREVPEQVGREAHKRVVFAPVVVSAMFKTRLLGAANMEQVN